MIVSAEFSVTCLAFGESRTLNITSTSGSTNDTGHPDDQQQQPSTIDSLAFQGMIAEFSAIQQEKIGLYQSAIQAASIGIPIAAAFVAYGYQTRNSVAFLCAAAVLSITSWFSLVQLRLWLDATAYTYLVLETQVPGLQREHIT